jgi:hypothetical protein
LDLESESPQAMRFFSPDVSNAYLKHQVKKLAIVLLDCEKAFDKIDHDRLRESLRRLEVPTHLLAIVNDIDANPKFRVSREEGSSEFFQQQSGIRQGCPLSPYLFILVMSLMFADLKARPTLLNSLNRFQEYIF